MNNTAEKFMTQMLELSKTNPLIRRELLGGFSKHNCIECNAPFSSSDDTDGFCGKTCEDKYHAAWDMSFSDDDDSEVCPHCGEPIFRFDGQWSCDSCGPISDEELGE